MSRTRLFPALSLSAVAALALAGCAGSPASGDGDSGDGGIAVVTSTNVYGQIVAEVGGDLVDVTSIITSGAQDPHSYEASARDQLTVSRADLIVENGGGYDAFMTALIEASGTEAPVVTAAEFSHDWPGGDGHDHDDDDHAHGDADESADDAHADDAAEHADGDATEHAEHAEDDAHADDAAADDHGHDHEGHGHIEGFNEHVWYDPHTIEHVAEGIADALAEIDPANAADYEANAAAFAEQIGGLEASLDEIAAAHEGTDVFATEPLPGYLLAAAGLHDVTPAAFSEAVEEGQDVAPATLLEALSLISDGDVRIVLANAQTGGAETDRIIDDAEKAGIPVLEFTETLPEGQTYISWMTDNIAELADALA